MDEIIKGLQRPLDMSEVEFMPKTTVNNGKTALLLAYKDARCDMKRLDEATGGLWQNEYKRDSAGVLQCGIGIKIGDEWVWKWSNGTPSNQEAEKGEYSDAFKRAGFMWGIGRELYDYPTIYCPLNDGEKLSWLRTKEWEWKIHEGYLWGVDRKTNKVRVKVEISGV